MKTARRSLLIALIALFSLNTALAQTEQPGNQAVIPLVTATASTTRVRYASLGEVQQTRLQVFSSTGEQVYDSGFRLGNLIDWRLVNQQGTHLSDGSYLYLVTIKDFSDRLTQKYGSAVLEQGQVYLEQSRRDELPQPQAAALEANRQADVLTAVDRIGAGFTQSSSTDGETVIDAAPSTGKKMAASSQTAPGGENIAGTGTLNRVSKWIDNAGTLGDSAITEISGKVGIGVTNPSYKLVVGPDIGAGLVAADLTISRGAGQSVSAFVGPTGARGMEFGWDEAGNRAFLNAPANTAISFLQGGPERMRIDAAGNVGIGTNVITPGSRLDVAGNINTSTQYNLGGNRLLGTGGGGSSTYVGISAGPVNTGIGNSFFGNGAGFKNTTGESNNFFGVSAGFFNIDGSRNTFAGYFAGFKNVNGSNNTFYGYNAGRENTAGGGGILSSGNAFFGADSGAANTTGYRNSFFGHESGLNNTTAGGNSFFGTTAGKENQTGESNSFFGFQAGLKNQTGGSNSFFGGNAGLNSLGAYNSFFGWRAGDSNTAGSNNTFVGVDAGTTNTAESNNTLIGYQADAAFEVVNSTAIGYKAKVTRSNSLLLGCTLSGCIGSGNDATNVGIGTGSPLARLHIISFSTNASDNTAIFASPNIGTNTSHIHYGTLGSWFIRSAASSGKVVLQDTGGNVGIGTASPNAKLHVANGSVYIAAPNSLIITAPNGTCWFITVNNSGGLGSFSVPCP